MLQAVQVQEVKFLVLSARGGVGGGVHRYVSAQENLTTGQEGAMFPALPRLRRLSRIGIIGHGPLTVS